MKDRFLIVSSFILFIIAIIIAEISHFTDNSKVPLVVFLSIIICGLSISFMVFALTEKNSKSAFFGSLKYSFGIGSLVLILGYFTYCLQSLIFN